MAGRANGGGSVEKPNVAGRHLFFDGMCVATGGTHLAIGVVWTGTVILAVIGLFWFLVGLITYLTGYE